MGGVGGDAMRRCRPISAANSVPLAPMSFSIPLKPTSKPVAFPADFEKHIALEFAMRYLCEVCVRSMHGYDFDQRLTSACGTAVRASLEEAGFRAPAGFLVVWACLVCLFKCHFFLFFHYRKRTINYFLLVPVIDCCL